MTRVRRYPRLCMLFCVMAFASAIARDACISAGQEGWARVLLVAVVASLVGCMALLSCRFVVDDQGVGVGFLLHMRRTPWEDLAALGALCCNSRRMYLYGMYKGDADFLRLLHRAPHCGRWGFVVPLNRVLADAVQLRCPYPVDLEPVSKAKRPHGMRALWRHAALYMLALIPMAVVACSTGWLMLVRAAQMDAWQPALMLTIFSGMFFTVCGFLLHRVLVSRTTCPAVSEEGVSIGRGLHLPWDEVRFGYVHRIARVSGFFLLSQTPDEIVRRGAKPVVCMSMPDTSTVLLAYLTYCPHASKDMDVRG